VSLACRRAVGRVPAARRSSIGRPSAGPATFPGTAGRSPPGGPIPKALAAHPDDIEAALTEYEQAMFPRSAEVDTFEGVEVHGIDSADNTAHGLIAMFTEMDRRGPWFTEDRHTNGAAYSDGLSGYAALGSGAHSCRPRSYRLRAVMLP
jgi:hypothetical protein